MNDYIEYEKIVPSKAVRTMMKSINLDDRSIVSLIMNGYFTWNERIEMLKLVEKSTSDSELRTILKEYIVFQDSILNNMMHNKEGDYLYTLFAHDGIGDQYRFFSRFDTALKYGSMVEKSFDIVIIKMSNIDIINDIEENRIKNSDEDEFNDFDYEYGRMRFNEKGELTNLIPGSEYKIADNQKDFSLLFSFVDIFNPFERGDIVCRVENHNEIGIVITSQRIWQSKKANHNDFNDAMIRVDFISPNAEVKNVSVCPINLEFVGKDCNLLQYDFLKSISNLIRGNGNVGMMLECYKELRDL